MAYAEKEEPHRRSFASISLIGMLIACAIAMYATLEFSRSRNADADIDAYYQGKGIGYNLALMCAMYHPLSYCAVRKPLRPHPR